MSDAANVESGAMPSVVFPSHLYRHDDIWSRACQLVRQTQDPIRLAKARRFYNAGPSLSSCSQVASEITRVLLLLLRKPGSVHILDAHALVSECQELLPGAHAVVAALEGIDWNTNGARVTCPQRVRKLAPCVPQIRCQYVVPIRPRSGTDPANEVGQRRLDFCCGVAAVPGRANDALY